MPTILGRRVRRACLFPIREESGLPPMPVRPPDDEAETVATAGEMFAVIQGSNHATAFAGWVVATCAMGLIIEAGAIRSVSHSHPLLAAALLPLAGAAVYVVTLLARARRVTAAAQRDLIGFVAATAPGEPGFAVAVWCRLRDLTSAARHRELLCRRALTWAYVTGAAFLAWSAAVTVIA